MSRKALWPLVFILFIGISLYLQQSRALLNVRSTAVDIMAPLQSALNTLSQATAGLHVSFRDSQSIDQSNQKLQQRVDELRRENVELWEIIAKQQASMEAMGFEKANPQWKYLPARVVAWDPSNVVRTVTMDKGRTNGVDNGMVVVSPGGLIGKVMEVSDRWAKVLLITDPRSTVNGLLQAVEGRPKGILQGQPDGLLRMKYLMAESAVVKGDVVVTSGLGGGFPPGIFVGWVLDVSYSDGQMFHEAEVRPAASLTGLTDVLVITDFKPLTLD